MTSRLSSPAGAADSGIDAPARWWHEPVAAGTEPLDDPEKPPGPGDSQMRQTSGEPDRRD